MVYDVDQIISNVKSSLYFCNVGSEEKICDFYDGIGTIDSEWAEKFNLIIEIILNDVKELSKEKQGLIAKFHRYPLTASILSFV